MENQVLEGQINIFEINETNEIKVNYTKEQLAKIEELKKEFEVDEVSISKANIASMKVKYKFPPIVPQGNTDNTIYPRWTHLIYFINELGEIIGNPGVGYLGERKQEGD